MKAQADKIEISSNNVSDEFFEIFIRVKITE